MLLLVVRKNQGVSLVTQLARLKRMDGRCCAWESVGHAELQPIIGFTMFLVCWEEGQAGHGDRSENSLANMMFLMIY